MAQMPGAAVIAASHTVELAQRWGRRVRNLVDRHSKVLGIAVARDNAAAGRWALTQGGEYYAAGVGVGIAGYRADLAVIDDPIRSRQDADSEVVRDGIWEWYKADLSTRLKPGGRIILIQTRWHEDDLAGRLLADMAQGGEEWHVLSLPAEAELNDALGRKPGEWLWDDDPEYGYGDQLRREKRVQTARNWSALYQQRPAPLTGDYFKKEWLRPYTTIPARATLRIYGGSDYAVTSDGGDYTAHVVVGLDPEGRMYLLDVWRQQTSSDVWIEALADLILKWKPVGWAEELIQITSGVGPFLTRRLRERKAWIARTQFPVREDKAVRAQSIRGRIALDGLYVPIHAPWYPDLESEMLNFPVGVHDDQVDALGLVGQLLDKMVAGEKTRVELPKPRRGYDAPSKRLENDVTSSVKLS
jgi:predicted phage terminase large subunit-like protein